MILKNQYEQINTNYTEQIDKNKSVDSLTLLHLNIRSLNKTFDEMYDFIQSLPVKRDIIGLSESRIPINR